MIKGGYYIKARKIQESEIAHKPPHVREIWDWLLKEANHSEQKSNGTVIKRGQCLRTYDDIIEGLHWMVGWRKMKYSKWDCEKAMKVLKKATMITTTKTTRGMFITICNYDTYQNPRNYESHNHSQVRKATRKPQTADTINKNVKKVKNEKKKIYGEYNHIFLTDKQYINLKDKVDDRDKWIKIMDESIEEKGNIYHIKNFYLAIIKWYKKEREKKPKPQRKVIRGRYYCRQCKKYSDQKQTDKQKYYLTCQICGLELDFDKFIYEE